MKNFNIIETGINDLILIEKLRINDNRGYFEKIYNKDQFNDIGFDKNFTETYYNYSLKNVIRGMHFQKHPHGHDKFVTVLKGKILDVVMGVEVNGDYSRVGVVYETILSDENRKSIYIPEGFAHGFLVLSEDAIVLNQTTSVYNPDSDAGINYKSYGFKWPIECEIVSERDSNLKIVEI